MTVIRKPARASHLDLALLQREVGQLIERLADMDRAAQPEEDEWVPPVDIYEARGRLIVVAEVPGMDPESLRVAFRDRHLVISGERRERRLAAGCGFLCMERPQGRFSRLILLDLALDVRQAEARLAGGLLTISIPRVKDRRGRETPIPVQREEGT
jgi:HSP20 family protein